MRRAVVLLCVMLGAAAPLAALDAYPKTTLAEDATATWCGYCPDAYAGLDVVHSHYNYGEFLSARYYATSGGLGTPETDAALAYYGINAFPTVVFNGLTKVVGGGAGIATGGPIPLDRRGRLLPAGAGPDRDQLPRPGERRHPGHGHDVLRDRHPRR